MTNCVTLERSLKNMTIIEDYLMSNLMLQIDFMFAHDTVTWQLPKNNKIVVTFSQNPSSLIFLEFCSIFLRKTSSLMEFHQQQINSKKKDAKLFKIYEIFHRNFGPKGSWALKYLNFKVQTQSFIFVDKFCIFWEFSEAFFR